MPATITCPDCGQMVEVRRTDYQRCAPCTIARRRRLRSERHFRTYPDRAEILREKAREWREANRDVSRACTASWASRNKSRKAAADRLWVMLNPERVKHLRHVDYERHKPKRLSAARQWAISNQVAARESRRARNARRRALLANAPGEWTREQFMALCAAADGLCAYCGTRPERLTADHVVPLARGGSNDIANIVPACLSCNASKGAKTADEFREYRGVRE